jgi:hypothetical protein
MIPKAKQIHKIPIPARAEFSGRYADQLAQLSFWLMIATSSREEYRDRGYWIPFSSQKGRTMFGGRWDAVRRAAVTDYPHIFEVNDHYSNFDGNVFPKSMRLAASYRTGETELYSLKRKHRQKSLLDFDALDKASSKLVGDFGQFYLPDAAPSFENAWQGFSWARIANGDYYASRCEWGRFHSNFTAFKHRMYLQHREPLVAIDIKSCQPLILGSLVHEALGASPDLDHWMQLCSDGTLYEYLAECLGVDRKTAKDGFIRCLFERRYQMLGMPEYNILLQMFPSIAQYLRDVKAAVGYQQVATNCQSLESTLLVDGVAVKLAKVPMVTVHDEFIVPARFKKTVQDELKKQFAKANMLPTFEITDLRIL